MVLSFEVINSKKREIGMTNAQLAEKTGVTLSTLDKITSGENKNPKLSTLQAIARVLGCTLDDFDDVNTLDQVISPAALSVAKKYDRLDSYSQAVVEAVVDLELARVNTLGGQTAVEISSDLPETERDHQGAEAAR